MANHQNNTKKNFKLPNKVMCLFLSVFTMVACSNINGKINIDSNGNKGQVKPINNIKPINNDKITKIAFEKNNSIYLYDETNGQIKSPGDNTKSKDLLALSPDKTKIVFRSFDEVKAVYPPHIIVYDIKTQALTDIIVNDNNVQQIIELKWIDNEHILVTGHIDPSASGYGVYNIKSKLEIMSCVGTIIDASINNKNILYSNTPHIFPQPKANFYLNGNKIFEVSDIKEQILDGVISKDGKMIAFRSGVEDKEIKDKTNTYLNIAKINSDGKTISEIKKITITNDTTGNLRFDDENNLSIISDEFLYKLENGKLIKEKNTLPKQEEISVEQLKKFKQTLSNLFPDEVISDDTVLEDIDVYNIISF
ncbi:hypothetical protein [Clostridium lacusfryxellense]|uniref:hypothetical protein n=1 Tax=Clostridium lacusfryxellense TaxID=205328 RepID=UPI001C0B5DDB|nr:hypothetical protein [Clostridium lacusfryxellense]MBU3112948.1 hypothetical protein [Clostridium lacusfryxellense]